MDNLRIEYEKQTYPIQKSNYAVKDECVYLLFNDITKLSKIGITTDLTERHRSLERQCGLIIELVGYCDIEKNEHEKAKYVESYLHNHFKTKRKEGEWFDLTEIEKDSIINLFYLISD